jgi:hypothetical protein
MSILHPQALFNPRSALVDAQGVPTTAYGRGLIQRFFIMTGSGTGILPSVSTPAVTATGNAIADAFQLTADWNDIESGAAGAGVAIAAALNLQPGNDIWVFNGTATNKNVYPPNAQTQIDALGAGMPYVLAAGKLRCFQCWQATQFHSYGN